MLIITGIITAESETEILKVKHALQKRAAQSRQDAGNIDYAFSINLEDSCEIRLTEKWESEELLHAHLQIPDDAFNAAMASAKMVSAKVISNEAGIEKVLLDQ